MPLSGTTGYVTVEGVAITADRWSAPLRQAAVDRANFTTGGEPSNAAGQRTGRIQIEGPYEGPMNVERGNVYAFKLGMTTPIFVTVNGRVTQITFSNDKDRGPRFQIEAEQYGSASMAAI